VATAVLAAAALSAGPATVVRHVSAGGGGESSGTSLTVRATLGEPVTGNMYAHSANYSVEAGFWGSSPEIVTGVEDEAPSRPERVELHQNTPNPFNPRTTIEFALPVETFVQLVLYDASGRKIRTLLDERVPAGSTRVTWDGTDDSGRAVASGVYVYQLRSPSFTASRKMVLVR
jgi:hypothetical protein